MTKSNLRQRDLERIFRAAKAIGASVQIDLKTLVVTVLPTDLPAIEADRGPVPFGEENWDEAVSPISPPLDGRELNAIEVLFKMPNGLWTSGSTIRSFGPYTQQKLLDRGFIELSAHATKNSDIRMTKKGRTDWALYQQFIEENPHL